MMNRRQARRHRTILGVALGLGLFAAACSSSDGAATGTTPNHTTTSITTDAPATAAPTTTVSASTSLLVESTSTTAAAGEASFVGTADYTFVDTTRPTGTVGDAIAAADERSISVVLRFPAFVDAETDDDAQPVPGQHPLVVLSHGLGGSPDYLQTTAERLVEAGYVVALPWFPESRDSGGAGYFVEQPADISFIIDQLAAVPTGDVAEGLIDFDRVGALGHSLGALTTLGLTFSSCCIEPDVDAAVMFAGFTLNYDGGEYEWPTTPLLLVHGSADETIPYQSSVDLTAKTQGPTYLLTLDDVDHGAGIWNNEHFDLMIDTVVAFLDEYVAGTSDRLGTISPDPALGSWETFNAA